MKPILQRKNPRENIHDRKLSDLADEKTKYSINIPRKLHYQFKRKAFLEDKDMKDIILDAIRKYVSS